MFPTTIKFKYDKFLILFSVAISTGLVPDVLLFLHSLHSAVEVRGHVEELLTSAVTLHLQFCAVLRAVPAAAAAHRPRGPGGLCRPQRRPQQQQQPRPRRHAALQRKKILSNFVITRSGVKGYLAEF